MTKIFKCLSVVFIVLMIMSVAVTSVAAADNPQRNNAIDASKYRMAMDNGLIYANFSTLQRWSTQISADDNNILSNHQSRFFEQTYHPSINYWNSNINKVVNNINSLTDDTVFTTYKEKLSKVMQEYIAALKAGEGCLACEVSKIQYSRIITLSRYVLQTSIHRGLILSH